METHERSSNPTDSPSPSAAAAALDEVRRTEVALAARMVSPWWYHPGFGVALALEVGSPALPDYWRTVALAAALVGLALLMSKARSTVGVARQYLGTAAGLRWVTALAGVPVLLMILSPIARNGWVTAGSLVAVVIWVSVVGPRMDAALRRQVAQGGARR